MLAEQEPLRLALVVGNADYATAGKLRNPVRDARAVAASLVELGFAVRTEYDLDGERFQRVVGEFIGELGRAAGRDGTAATGTTGEAGAAGAVVQPGAAGAGATGSATRQVVAVLFYAGHGVQVRGQNYLLPIDSLFGSEADLQLRTVNLGIVMEAMNSIASISIVMLDCCRDNPLPRITGGPATRSLASHHGLAGVNVPNGSFVAYATQPDAVADDGTGVHSPFTEALLRYISQPDTPISEMMIHVRRTVHETTGGRQIPWDRSALFQPFAFRQSRGLVALPPVDAATLAEQQIEQDAKREAEYWALIETSDSPELLQSFIVQFPHSTYRPQALAKIDKLRYRRWRNRVVLNVASVVVGLSVLFGLFTAVEYMRFTDRVRVPGGGQPISLNNADLIGYDISLPVTHERGTSMMWCRMKCIFEPKCVAVSWNPGKFNPKTGQVSRSICYTKLDALYFMRPDARRGDDPSNTEYMRRRGRPAPRELPANWTLHWDRTLVGDLVAEQLVLQDKSFLDNDGKDPKREDGRTKKQYWSVSNASCHKRCVDLGPDCKGLSFTPFGFRCQLFGKVTGIARDANNLPVHTPTVHSACNDLAVPDCAKSQ